MTTSYELFCGSLHELSYASGYRKVSPNAELQWHIDNVLKFYKSKKFEAMCKDYEKSQRKSKKG